MNRLMMILMLALLPASGRADTACVGNLAGRDHVPRILPASLGANEVGLTFVGHATFLIESPKGVRIATDYNDYIRPRAVPDIATMNRAHDTHFSLMPDPRIKHVLHGWGEGGAMAQHDLTMQDTRVRNVPTNIRSGGGTQYNGNSIFIFEMAGLCIAHLGHLHHTLEPEHFRAIGQLDVVLVPVDGSYTMDLDGMIEVLKGLNAKLMIPMHYFGRVTLDRFLDRLGQDYDIKRSDTASITLRRETLPEKGTVLVLPGR